MRKMRKRQRIHRSTHYYPISIGFHTSIRELCSLAKEMSKI